MERENEHEQEQVESTEAPENPILETMRSRGYEFDDGFTDDQLLTELAEGWDKVKGAPPQEELERFNQHLPVLNDYIKHASDFHEYLKSKQSEEEPPPSPESPKWESLDFDPSWEAVTEWDNEAQRYVPRGKYGSAQAAEERNRYEQALRERARRLTNDPIGVLREAGLETELQKLRKELREEVLTEFRNEQTRLTQQQKVDQYFEQHEKELFVFENDRPRLDRNGQYIPNERGQLYMQAITEARELGIQDRYKAHEYAVRQLGRYEEPENSESRNAQKKSKFLERVKNTNPSRQTNRDTETSRKVSTPGNGADRWAELIKEAREELSVA